MWIINPFFLRQIADICIATEEKGVMRGKGRFMRYTFWVLGALLTASYSPYPMTKLKIVVIDAGHGGKDPGTHGKKAQEKDVALSVAKKVTELFKKHRPDIRVIMTRSEDVFVPLYDRADIANKHKADLFVSIHCNANQRQDLHGSETYAMGVDSRSTTYNEVAMRENMVILQEKDYLQKYDGFDPRSAETYILFDLIQSVSVKQSLELAHYVEAALQSNTKRHSRGVKQASFVVLWRTTMPSILCEIGFLTNPEEETYLVSEVGQDLIAKSIYEGVIQYETHLVE